ncbi:MAG: GH3 auxin-responsive promoter family protein, partial [Saprospiraceae bacterium]|nr:GH3 auxin-responsive promoter family protein [Saprospiraceae bacterium]
APVYFSGDQGKGGHEWVVEFEREPSDLERFNEVLDLMLQQINSDYEAKRFKSMALRRLHLQTVPRGTFHRWMRARGKFGNQNKVPRLANHRNFVEEIMQFVASSNA